jgi:hypothetical protein
MAKLIFMKDLNHIFMKDFNTYYVIVAGYCRFSNTKSPHSSSKTIWLILTIRYVEYWFKQ